MPEFGRRAAVGLTERGAEVTVTGKAEGQAEGGEVVILGEKIQGPCEPKPQLIAIEGQSFHLLKYLSEINRGTAYFGCDLSQRPTARWIARQHELGSIDEPLPTETGSRRVTRAWSQRPPHQRQRKALSFQGFRDALAQAVPK